MYELKTLLPQFEINVPKCMYEMKNISLSANAVESVSSDVSSARTNLNGFFNINGKSTSTSTASAVSTCCPLDLDILGSQIQQLLKVSNDGAQNVALRQEMVMQQLNDLKAQLASIRSTLGLSSKATQHSSSSTAANNGGLKEEPLPDMVINGHPNFIPYALLAVKNAWKDLFTLNIKTFTHSTMNDIGKEAEAFENSLRALPVNPNLPKINLTLIWKNCEHTEIICSPTMYVPIYGEVNLIRYLGRIGPNEYRYENSPFCNEIDAVLDICYQLLRCTTPKAKANMIRLLNNRLQKQQFFGGDKLSIADIGVHSSLRRMHTATDKELTPALIEWCNRVEKYTLI